MKKLKTEIVVLGTGCAGLNAIQVVDRYATQPDRSEFRDEIGLGSFAMFDFIPIGLTVALAGVASTLVTPGEQSLQRILRINPATSP